MADNPALLLVAPQVNNVAPKAIPDEVWRALWCHKSLDGNERTALALGFYCGLRRQEVVDLSATHFLLPRPR